MIAYLAPWWCCSPVTHTGTSHSTPFPSLPQPFLPCSNSIALPAWRVAEPVAPTCEGSLESVPSAPSSAVIPYSVLTVTQVDHGALARLPASSFPVHSSPLTAGRGGHSTLCSQSLVVLGCPWSKVQTPAVWPVPFCRLVPRRFWLLCVDTFPFPEHKQALCKDAVTSHLLLLLPL